MARLLITTPEIRPTEIRLNPGCNRFGREGDNDFLIPHASVSRSHCEVWLTDDGVLIRDLGSRNGTFVEGAVVQEAQLFGGQTLRVGDVEMVLADAPAKISVPELPLSHQPKTARVMPDGSPCCLHHDAVAALFQCNGCQQTFCRSCVRELRVAGGTPRRFCPECNHQCERLIPLAEKARRGSWLTKIVDVLMKPPSRRR